MAEACGSRTQTFDSQVPADDDVAASAKFQLESIGVTPSIIFTTLLGLHNIARWPFLVPGIYSDITARAVSVRFWPSCLEGMGCCDFAAQDLGTKSRVLKTNYLQEK